MAHVWDLNRVMCYDDVVLLCSYPSLSMYRSWMNGGYGVRVNLMK